MPLFCTLLPLQCQQIFVNNAFRVPEPMFVRAEFNNLWIEHLPHGPKLLVLIYSIFRNNKCLQHFCRISASSEIADKLCVWLYICFNFFFGRMENKISK